MLSSNLFESQGSNIKASKETGWWLAGTLCLQAVSLSLGAFCYQDVYAVLAKHGTATALSEVFKKKETITWGTVAQKLLISEWEIIKHFSCKKWYVPDCIFPEKVRTKLMG